MTSNQDWRYDEERLKLRGQCIRVLLAKLGTVKIDDSSYSTQNIYECVDTWVSQGNASTSGLVSFISTLTSRVNEMYEELDTFERNFNTLVQE